MLHFALLFKHYAFLTCLLIKEIEKLPLNQWIFMEFSLF